MISLSVTARLLGAVSMPDRPLALDALLAYAVVLRDHITPAATPADVVPIGIPLKLEPLGRFHLCSHAVFTRELAEGRTVSKRPVVGEAQAMGAKITRMQINAGHSKSYRIPYDAFHMVGDEIRWWAIGDRDGVRDLLGLITHLGRHRRAGLGRVHKWSVEPCESWGNGFPVLAPDGYPLRPLPLDWPGLAPDADREYCTLTYPYPRTLNTNVALCAVPTRT